MTALWEQPWFWPALTVVVALPVTILVLTEVLSALQRAQHPAATPVRLARNFLVPSLALLVLIAQVQSADIDVTWTRVVATAAGFLIILVVLSGFNVALFASAGRGTWRDRLPKIFIDLARFVLIVAGLGLLFSIVWGADVGGLFTALGVSSIVLGLALQNAAGSVVSGLLMLFEQPFRIGDWIDAGGVRGRVLEVNWRSVHIESGNGVLIVPNASLADGSIQNLSRTEDAYVATLSVTFATDDAPNDVMELLREVGSDLPYVLPSIPVRAATTGKAAYSVSLPLAGPAEEDDATTLFLARLWYAARRAGLHLDADLTDDYATPERTAAFARHIAPSLRIGDDEVDALAGRVALQRFGAGETVLRAGELPRAVRFVVEGLASASAVPLETDGALLPVRQVVSGEMIGVTALTRQPSPLQITATTDLSVLHVPVDVLDEIVTRQPELARDLGRAIDSDFEVARGARR